MIFFYNQVFSVQIGHIARENTLVRGAFAWCLVQCTITIRKIQTEIRQRSAAKGDFSSSFFPQEHHPCSVFKWTKDKTYHLNTVRHLLRCRFARPKFLWNNKQFASEIQIHILKVHHQAPCTSPTQMSSICNCKQIIFQWWYWYFILIEKFNIFKDCLSFLCWSKHPFHICR